jgi:hypothetical protein
MSEASERAFWHGLRGPAKWPAAAPGEQDVDIADHELVYDDGPAVVRLAPPSRLNAARATILICAGFIAGIVVAMIGIGAVVACRTPVAAPVDFTIHHLAEARR